MIKPLRMQGQLKKIRFELARFFVFQAVISSSVATLHFHIINFPHGRAADTFTLSAWSLFTSISDLKCICKDCNGKFSRRRRD